MTGAEIYAVGVFLGIWFIGVGLQLSALYPDDCPVCRALGLKR
jgi:hypothetical protein